MSTHTGKRLGLGNAAKGVADRARSLVQLELQLAAEELKKKFGMIAGGVGLFAAAALFAFFAVAFGLGAIAAGLATTVSIWLALLIMMVALILLVALLIWIGVTLIRRSTPLVPEQAIEEAKLTVEAVKNGAR